MCKTSMFITTATLALTATPLATKAQQTERAIERTVLSLEQTVCEQFAQMYELKAPQYEVTLRRGQESLKRINDDTWDSLSVRPLSKSQPKGLFPIMIEAIADGAVRSRAQATVHVARYDSVLVATTNISRGTALTGLQITNQWLEITQLYEKPLAVDTKLDGWQTKRTLKPGAIITSEAIEQVPVVRRGDDVTIAVIKGLVQITAGGQALQSGVLGETIKVRSAESRKVIKATIVGPGAVEIAGGRS